MMKIMLRALGIILAVVLGLLVLAGAYLAFVFDPNDYRERIESEVQTRTGRALEIEGDIGLSLFPWLGVELGEVRLGNAEGFGDSPFAAVQEVQVRARLLPLLRSELEVDRVVLKGLALDLQRDDQGRTNWDDLIAAGDAQTPAEPESEQADGEAAARALAAFVISGIEIDQASAVWHDRVAGVRHVIEDLSVQSGEVRPGTAFPLSLSFAYALSEPRLEGEFELDTTVLIEPDDSRALLSDLVAQLDVQGEGVPGERQQVRMESALALDLAEQRWVLEPFSLLAATLQLQGQARGQWADGVRGEGVLESGAFDPGQVLSALAVKRPDTADDQVLQHGLLSAHFDFDANSLQLDDLTLELDESTLKGELGIVDFARQAIRFDLALDEIDLDRYLPERDSATGGTPGAAAAAIDPELLRGRDIAGRVRVGRLILGGMTVSDVELQLKGQDGVLELSPLDAALYEGRYAGDIRLDGREQTLAIALNESLEGVQIGPLLRDLTGEEARLTGRAELSAQLRARGNDADAIKRSLSGDAAFALSDGAVRGVNVGQLLRQARARLSGQPAPDGDAPNRTDFSRLNGTLRVDEGVIRNDDLDLRSPLLRVGGEGRASLVDEQIDYRLRASVVGTLEGQGGADLADLRGVTVPIRVSGSFDSPRYALDVESLLSESVRDRGRQEIEERLQEQVPHDVRERLQRGLGDLFGR